jgi:hypothetical protein
VNHTKKQILTAFTLILAAALIQVGTAQTETLAPTICIYTPTIDPELNQNFTLTLSTTNFTEALNVTASLTWNSTNLQIINATAGTYGENNLIVTATNVANQTLTEICFIANSTDPADLTISALLTANESAVAFNYFVPYYEPFNSVKTPET